MCRLTASSSRYTGYPEVCNLLWGRSSNLYFGTVLYWVERYGMVMLGNMDGLPTIYMEFYEFVTVVDSLCYPLILLL